MVVLIGACTSAIKDQKSAKENPAEDSTEVVDYLPQPTEILTADTKEDLVGYWVGWFVPDVPDSLQKHIYTGEYNPWNYANLINVSIDSFAGDSVFGHSVVANNYQIFRGAYFTKNDSIFFNVKEPGNDKHDGAFRFSIALGDSIILGKWEAYGAVETPKRKYSLSKRIFKYDANHELSDRFIDWTKYKDLSRDRDGQLHLEDMTVDKTKENIAEYLDIPIGSISDEEIQNYIEDILSTEGEYDKEYFGTNYDFAEVNPSAQLLSKTQVENLTKADIYVLRNSIYARHGYSFRNRQLRAYFDKQDWYIPVHANIKSDLTEIEKKNIQLLLKYEDHAEEYYDEFGRG